MKPHALKELLRNSMRDNPDASEKEIRDICERACARSSELQRDLFQYWFVNSYGDFVVERFAPSQHAIMATRADKSRGSTQVGAAGRSEGTHQIKNEMLACFMDYSLPDGTPLRFATFGQCAQAGGWLEAIGRQGKANEVVGKKLTEIDLRNLMIRNLRKVTA